MAVKIDVDILQNFGVIVCVKITSEPSTVDEEQKYRKGRRRQHSAALSTPPAVHVHIGSDGPTSNGSLSSRGIYASDTAQNIGSRQNIVGTGIIISLGLQNLITLLYCYFIFFSLTLYSSLTLKCHL